MDRVFEWRSFAVEVGRSRFPNGSEHDVAIVRHRPSVVVAPMLEDGQLLLIRQYRPSLGRDELLVFFPATSLTAVGPDSPYRADDDDDRKY